MMTAVNLRLPRPRVLPQLLRGASAGVACLRLRFGRPFTPEYLESLAALEVDDLPQECRHSAVRILSAEFTYRRQNGIKNRNRNLSLSLLA